VWEIDAIIMPSKYIIQTSDGRYNEILVVDPKQIVGQINEESYNRLIATELNLDIREIPKLKAENLKDTNLVRISTKENNIEKGKFILSSLFNHLKKELDGKVDVEIKGVDTNIANHENIIKKKNIDIQSKKIEKSRLEQEILSAQNKLKISEERFKSIMEEMKTAKERIDELEKQLKKVLAEKKVGTDAVSLLLYSNEVQHNLRYYNTLDEKLNNEKITQENLRLRINNKEKDKKQIDTQIEKLRNEIEDTINQIDLLFEKRSRIDYAQFIKEPTSSLYPVAPRKKRNVLIAGILGLMIFTTLAFFLDYLEKQRIKSKG
jgi:capsular polysaccharide biosynthesis protein